LEASSGAAYWIGSKNVTKEGLIAEQDLSLFRVVDNADDAVAHIKAFYDKYSVSVNF
jgi:predicted Rossmann-fold nucleotide-binding protein